MHRIDFYCHTNSATERFENCLNLVMCIVAAQIVDVQGYFGMVNEALEKLVEQVYIEIANRAAFER
jgi:hypothetical protein